MNPPAVSEIRLHVTPVTWRATWVALEVEDDRGTRGIGECSGLSRPSPDLEQQVEAVRRLLAGHPVDEARQVVPDDVPALLRHALELALSDLSAKGCGAPLDLLPASRYRETVSLYANINRAEQDRTSEKLAALGARAAAANFAAVKLAPFDDADPAHGLAHLRALRSAIGPQIDLMVDCHERLQLDDVLAILPELEALNVVWLEDALALNDVAGWKELARHTRIPLATGEKATRLADLLPLLDTGLLSYVLPDVKVAGVTGCYEILMAATAAGVGASLHNPTGPVATAASLLVAAAVPVFHRLEFAFGEAAWRGQLLEPPEEIRSGALPVPRGPGLGVSLGSARTPVAQQ